MAASQGSISLAASFTFTEAFGQFNTDSLPIRIPGLSQALTAGAGAAAFNNVYAVSSSVVSGTPVVYTINGGSLKNPDGTTASLGDIIFLYLFNYANSGGNLVLGGGTDPVTSILGATGTITLLPGSYLVLAAPVASGWGVTASTACNLELTSSAGTSSFDLLVAGH